MPYARAIAIASLIVCAAFGVLVGTVGRGETTVTFTLPAAAGLVAMVSSGVAARRATADNTAGATRAAVLAIVWGAVAIAAAIVALAVILNSTDGS